MNKYFLMIGLAGLSFSVCKAENVIKQEETEILAQVDTQEAPFQTMPKVFEKHDSISSKDIRYASVRIENEFELPSLTHCLTRFFSEKGYLVWSGDYQELPKEFDLRFVGKLETRPQFKKGEIYPSEFTFILSSDLIDKNGKVDTSHIITFVEGDREEDVYPTASIDLCRQTIQTLTPFFDKKENEIQRKQEKEFDEAGEEMLLEEEKRIQKSLNERLAKKSK